MFGFARPKRVTLLAMRLADMPLCHPRMIVEDCSLCGHQVGVFPSGQDVMRKYGARVDLVCHVCQQPAGFYVPAPGALAEMSQSACRTRHEQKDDQPP